MKGRDGDSGTEECYVQEAWKKRGWKEKWGKKEFGRYHGAGVRWKCLEKAWEKEREDGDGEAIMAKGMEGGGEEEQGHCTGGRGGLSPWRGRGSSNPLIVSPSTQPTLYSLIV